MLWPALQDGVAPLQSMRQLINEQDDAKPPDAVKTAATGRGTKMGQIWPGKGFRHLRPVPRPEAIQCVTQGGFRFARAAGWSRASCDGKHHLVAPQEPGRPGRVVARDGRGADRDQVTRPKKLPQPRGLGRHLRLARKA
jgi:hypothetical protein